MPTSIQNNPETWNTGSSRFSKKSSREKWLVFLCSNHRPFCLWWCGLRSSVWCTRLFILYPLYYSPPLSLAPTSDNEISTSHSGCWQVPKWATLCLPQGSAPHAPCLVQFLPALSHSACDLSFLLNTKSSWKFPSLQVSVWCSICKLPPSWHSVITLTGFKLPVYLPSSWSHHVAAMGLCHFDLPSRKNLLFSCKECS